MPVSRFLRKPLRISPNRYAALSSEHGNSSGEGEDIVGVPAGNYYPENVYYYWADAAEENPPELERAENEIPPPVPRGGGNGVATEQQVGIKKRRRHPRRNRVSAAPATDPVSQKARFGHCSWSAIGFMTLMIILVFIILGNN